jgi:hypothetical protein
MRFHSRTMTDPWLGSMECHPVILFFLYLFLFVYMCILLLTYSHRTAELSDLS